MHARDLDLLAERPDHQPRWRARLGEATCRSSDGGDKKSKSLTSSTDCLSSARLIADAR